MYNSYDSTELLHDSTTVLLDSVLFDTVFFDPVLFDSILFEMALFDLTCSKRSCSTWPCLTSYDGVAKRVSHKISCPILNPFYIREKDKVEANEERR